VSITLGNNLNKITLHRDDITKKCSKISSFSTVISEPKYDVQINKTLPVSTSQNIDVIQKQKKSKLIISDDEDEKNEKRKQFNKQKEIEDKIKLREKNDFSIIVQCDQIKIDYAAPHELLSTFDCSKKIEFENEFDGILLNDNNDDFNNNIKNNNNDNNSNKIENKNNNENENRFSSDDDDDKSDIVNFEPNMYHKLQKRRHYKYDSFYQMKTRVLKFKIFSPHNVQMADKNNGQFSNNISVLFEIEVNCVENFSENKNKKNIFYVNTSEIFQEITKFLWLKNIEINDVDKNEIVVNNSIHSDINFCYNNDSKYCFWYPYCLVIDKIKYFEGFF
jgi:hypothetical protein